MSLIIAIDPCLPNPCQNGGICSLTFRGAPTCLCANEFSGQYCSIPPQPRCPGDLCATPSLYVYRSDEGDIVSVDGVGLSEGYCLGIDGYCVSGERDNSDCPNCRCKPADIFQYSTRTCTNSNQGI